MRPGPPPQHRLRARDLPLLRQRAQHNHRRRRPFETELIETCVVVTGISGNLGARLLPLLKGFSVIGVDVSPPTPICPCSLSVGLGRGIVDTRSL